MVEYILLNGIIDSMKGRDVSIADVTGAHLSTDMENDVDIFIRGHIMRILILLDTNLHRNNTIMDAKGI